MNLYEMYLKNEANVSAIAFNTIRSIALAESGEYNPDFYPLDDAKSDILMFLIDGNGDFSEYCRLCAVKYGNIMRKEEIDEAKAEKALKRFNFMFRCMEKTEWEDEEVGLFLGLVKSVCYIVTKSAGRQYRKCNNPSVVAKIDVDMKNCFKATAGLDGSRTVSNNDALISANMAFYHRMSSILKLSKLEKLVLRHVYVNTWTPEELSGDLRWAKLNLQQISEFYGEAYHNCRYANKTLKSKMEKWYFMENEEKQKLLSEISGTLEYQKKEYSECMELMYEISEYLITMCENVPVFDTEDENF